MSLLPVPMEVTSLNLSGVNLTFVAVVGVIALIALVMAMIFRREVLAANDGTPNMQSIARAVQEGASAYLGRQFRTLSVFAVAAFFLLLLLPVHASAEFSSLIADSEATKVAIDRVAQQRFVENSAAREREVAHA